MYTARVLNGRRDELRSYLSNKLIDTGIHWQPGHKFKYFKHSQNNDLKVTEKISEQIITLPLHSNMKNDDIDYKKLLESFVSSCDVIVHLAGVNRANSDEEVYSSNIEINNFLKKALINTSFKGHLIFASSFQEDSDSLYGKAKKESRLFLEQTISELGGKYTGLIIPNVFGPFCKPNYNSFIATFSDKLINNKTPVSYTHLTLPTKRIV